MRIAVVILNWNGKKLLEKFLPEVISHSQHIAQIVVADNASTDDSISFLQQNFSSVKIISIDKNLGFAGGYNYALKQVDADYYVILNSDIEVNKNWIEPVIDVMNKDDSVAACQPKILSYSKKDFFEHAGAAGGFIDFLGYPFCRGRMFDTVEPDHGQYNDERDIFWATGACLFIRAGIFHRLGGFDESFFAHMEEIDLCWRIQQQGFKIRYVPQSSVYHIGGGTLPKINPRKTFYNFRNNLMMLHKNLSFFRLVFVFIIRFFLDLAAALKFLFDGGRADAAAVFNAYIWFYSHLGEQIKKRKQNRSTIKNKSVTGIYFRSLVVDYYFLGRSKFSHLKAKHFS